MNEIEILQALDTIKKFIKDFNIYLDSIDSYLDSVDSIQR